MGTRTKLSFTFPKFFEAISTAKLEQETRDAFKNLIRVLEKLQRETAIILNKEIAETSWTAVSSFSNSWANLGSTFADASYMKIANDMVILKGAIQSGTVTAAAFTLPAGYRPGEDLTFAVNSNGAFGQLRINSDGSVIPNVGSNTSFYLDGVIFRSEG